MAHLEGELFHWSKLPLETVPCPLCGSAEYSLYERYGEELQYSYVKCRHCRFIFQNPRFEYGESFLKWAYSWYGEEFIRHAGSTYPSQEGNRYFAFKKALCDRFTTARPYKLLDVGCACGQFLAFCHGKDCIATGVEASAQQVEFARRHLPFELVVGTTADLKDRAGEFDVAHIAHTLEHVPDPKTVLKEMLTVLRPGGLLFVEVPNVLSLKNFGSHLGARAGWKKNGWRAGDFPEHLVEFGPATLKRMLRDLDLEIVYFQTHSKSGLDKRPHLVGADFLLNKVVPLGNNMICLARKRFNA